MKRTLLVLFVVACVASLASTHAGKEKLPPVGGTRVAVVNIGRLFSTIRSPRFKAMLEDSPATIRAKAKKIVHEMVEWERKISTDDLSETDRRSLEEKIQNAKRQLEDLNREMTNLLGKQSEARLVRYWNEIRRAIDAYATENGIDIVLGYADPLEKELLARFPNVNRKMQAMDQGGALPVFTSPRADITDHVVKLLRPLK